MPHALLLHGVAGLGKVHFAHWLARALLCERPGLELKPCNACASCKLNASGTHPDLVMVAPEEDKQQISVDQVRAANERLSITSTRGGYRVAIVEPAHQMTIAAANSLLKTLEEPGANSLIILVTSQAASLLPTLRSRCQHLGMAAPDRAMAQAWLQTTSGKTIPDEVLDYACDAPLRALGYVQTTTGAASFESLRDSMSAGLTALSEGGADLTQLAQGWADDQLIERLNWLDFWLAGRIRREILRTADPVTRESLHGTAQVLNISALFQALDKLRDLKSILRRTSLQKELALGMVLMMVQRAMQVRP
jgi:DNA polymerase-3 subunit delta'